MNWSKEWRPVCKAIGWSVGTAGSADGVVRVWDTAKDDPLFTLPGHTDAVRRLAFSPDGLRLVTAGKDGDIRVWDLRRTGTSKVLKDPSRSVFSAAFDPRSRRVVTGSLT